MAHGLSCCSRANSIRSLHPDWLNATLSAWSLDGSAIVAEVQEGRRTRAVIPFLVRTRNLSAARVRCLELCSNVFSYHAELLSDGDLSKNIEGLLKHPALPAWDVFRVVNVVTDGPTARAMRTVAAASRANISVRPGERSPYVAVDRDWKSYLQTRPKKVRANISRSQRLMQEAGETGMEWYEVGADARRLLSVILEIEARSWKADAGLAITAGTPQCAYYERLLPWLAANGILANILYVKARPVAYVLCASWSGWVGQLKTSFVAELPDAGSRVIHSSLEKAFSTGAREYDFLGDAAPHKMRWTDRVRDHEDLWLFAPHLRGRALGQLKRLSDRVHAWRERRANTPMDAGATGQGSET